MDLYIYTYILKIADFWIENPWFPASIFPLTNPMTQLEMGI